MSSGAAHSKVLQSITRPLKHVKVSCLSLTEIDYHTISCLVVRATQLWSEQSDVTRGMRQTMGLSGLHHQEIQMPVAIFGKPCSPPICAVMHKHHQQTSHQHFTMEQGMGTIPLKGAHAGLIIHQHLGQAHILHSAVPHIKLKSRHTIEAQGKEGQTRVSVRDWRTKSVL